MRYRVTPIEKTSQLSLLVLFGLNISGAMNECVPRCSLNSRRSETLRDNPKSEILRLNYCLPIKMFYGFISKCAIFILWISKTVLKTQIMATLANSSGNYPFENDNFMTSSRFFWWQSSIIKNDSEPKPLSKCPQEINFTIFSWSLNIYRA